MSLTDQGPANWGVCRKFVNETTESPDLGGNVTGDVHTLQAGKLTYTVTQGPAGVEGESWVAATTLMNSYATDAADQSQVRVATGHFRLEFGTEIYGGGSEFAPAGGEDEPTTVEPMTDVSITFSDVESGGATNVVKTTHAPALPEGFQLGGDGLFYEIQTTVDYDPPITVCFPVADFPKAHAEILQRG